MKNKTLIWKAGKQETDKEHSKEKTKKSLIRPKVFFPVPFPEFLIHLSFSFVFINKNSGTQEKKKQDANMESRKTGKEKHNKEKKPKRALSVPKSFSPSPFLSS